MESASNFGSLRSILWPIHRHELKKLVPLIIIIFLLCFNYTILRNVKDVIVITAKSSGAEVLPFIKVWIILPAAVLITWVFTKLSRTFKREHVFYILTSFFLGYYLLFALVLYPIEDKIHLHQFCDFLTAHLPSGFYGFISMIRNWSFTLFYLMAELWAACILGVLFWGFVNDITQISQAKRFYGILLFSGNVSAAIAGYLGVICTQINLSTFLPYGNNAWEQSLINLTILIILAGALSMLIFRWMNRHVLSDERLCNKSSVDLSATTKARLSLVDSLRTLTRSSYLMCIAAIVVGYNLSINLSEVIWKNYVKDLYPNPHDFNLYLNELTIVTGVISAIASLFIPLIISKLGWTFLALITPLIMLVASAAFFILIFVPVEYADLVMQLFGMSTLTLAVSAGSLNNALSKGLKYSVFDTSKELAFIPLSQSTKIEGKAAIDGVGSRLGKSGGSIIQQGLFILFGSLLSSIAWIGALLLVVFVAWISATVHLGKQFKELTQEPAPDYDPIISSEATTLS